MRKPKIEFFTSSEEIGIVAFQKFNKFMLKSSDVGSEFADFDKHFQKITQFINSDLKSEAIKELENFRGSIFSALTDESPKSEAFACLVKSIDGKPVGKLTGSEIERIVKALDKAGYTKKERDEITSEVKKKSKLNFFSIFQRSSKHPEGK